MKIKDQDTLILLSTLQQKLPVMKRTLKLKLKVLVFLYHLMFTRGKVISIQKRAVKILFYKIKKKHLNQIFM